MIPSEVYVDEVRRNQRRQLQLLEAIASIVWANGTADGTGRTLRFPRMLFGPEMTVEAWEDPATLDVVVRVRRRLGDDRVPSSPE